MRHALAIFFTAAFVSLVATTASAQNLVADMSDHHVALSSSFTGTEIIVFGAIEGEPLNGNTDPYDVVVVVEGPSNPITVRRKGQVAGIWMNTGSLTLEHLPSYYFVASSSALNEIAPPRIRQFYRIGSDVLGLPDVPLSQDENPSEFELYREAYVRLSMAEGLVVEDPSGVRFRGDRLFRARVPIPSTVREGSYSASVYLFQGETILGAQVLTLTIDKVGIEGTLNNLAHQQPVLYGILALVMAFSVAWGATMIFRPR